MKRRQFIKTTAVTSLATSALAATSAAALPAEGDQEFYELRVYTLRGGGAVQALGQYLQQALIPALNRQGVKTVGVFKEMAAPEPPKLYVLIPYPSAAHFAGAAEKLRTDETYQQDGAAYDHIPLSGQLYYRYDTYLMQAFSGIPQMTAPAGGQRIFELRTYEGFSEDAVRRKVAMFNDGEIDIFYQTKLNPVFFGHLLAGPNMPALIYMLTFKDMAERDKNWQDFIDHPEWKRISKLPEYADTVSRIIRVFLEPAEYSQV